MNELLDWLFRIIESQGIIAGLLVLMMLQNSMERKAILKKNCELSRFIMHICQQKIDEDVSVSNHSQASPSPQGCVNFLPK